MGQVCQGAYVLDYGQLRMDMSRMTGLWGLGPTFTELSEVRAHQVIGDASNREHAAEQEARQHEAVRALRLHPHLDLQHNVRRSAGIITCVTSLVYTAAL